MAPFMLKGVLSDAEKIWKTYHSCSCMFPSISFNINVWKLNLFI